MEQAYKGRAAEEATAVVDASQAVTAGPAPGDGAANVNAPFNLLPRDSKHLIQWDPPSPCGGREDEGHTVVVLLGWLGARQKHLRRYADLYRDRGGVRTLRFVVPIRKIMGLHLAPRFFRIIADLSAMVAAWCDGDSRRTLLFHTFSNTGWLAYGAVLENLQSRPDITERIRGCMIDSAPVLDITPKVWAAGFTAAMLKKRGSSAGPSAVSPDGSALNGALNEVNNFSKLTKQSWRETVVRSTLQKIFKVFLCVTDVNKGMRKLLAVLSEKQPSCPQFYLYSSADTVIPAECVESFISMQKSLGLNVSAHNFVWSPHVDHYRSFPHLYSAKLDEFLKICSPAEALAVETETGATRKRD